MKFQIYNNNNEDYFFKKKKLQAHDGDPITCYFLAISVERSKKWALRRRHTEWPVPLRVCRVGMACTK